MSQELYTEMEKAPQRAFLKALGLTDDELKKPLVAVVSARSDIMPGHIRLDSVTDAVKAGVYANGCTPVVVPAIGVCDGIAAGHKGMRYTLPARELTADGVETVLRAHMFDGAVFVAGSDSVVPGMLMGAARVNIPSVFISCGPTESGLHNGKKAGASSVFDGVGAVKGGSLDRDGLTSLENSAYPSYGSGNGLSAANALNCMAEALGMAPVGNGTVLASSSERLRLAKNAGKAVCDLVRDAITPRMIMTKRALINALTVAMAIGAPTDTVMHLIAIAAECNVPITLKDIQNSSDKTPLLCTLFPLSDFDLCEFGAAGGVMAVLHELAKRNLTDGSVYTVNGCSLADCYENAQADGKVIHYVDEPISPVGGIAVLTGTLAEEGALISRAATPPKMLVFSGKAKVFNCEEDAVVAIYDGKVSAGDAVIIRNEGPVGGPGMREMLSPAAALCGMGLGDKVALITDGRAPGGEHIAAVGNVCPEAALGGKIALVADGDPVKIDVKNGRINLDVPAKMLDARRKKLRPRDNPADGWLLRYQNLVLSASEGAVLKKKF